MRQKLAAFASTPNPVPAGLAGTAR